MNLSPEPGLHSVLYRRAVLPILALLRMGADPRKLAWSIAAGLVIGVNPLIGSTTLVCLGAALLFKLNIAASQLANHLVYPLEVLLVIPFLRLGALVFRTGPIPLSPKSLFTEARAHPVEFMQSIWVWEWHALVLWAAISILLLPALVALLTPVLRRLLTRVERHEYPIVESI